MREIRLYGSEGGGAARSPYPYPGNPSRCSDSASRIQTVFEYACVVSGGCQSFAIQQLVTPTLVFWKW